jgi:hypothetical protein
MRETGQVATCTSQPVQERNGGCQIHQAQCMADASQTKEKSTRKTHEEILKKIFYFFSHSCLQPTTEC